MGEVTRAGRSHAPIMNASANQLGKTVFSKVEKANSELFSLTYGAIVMQLLKDFEEVDATNEQLEKM